MTALMRQSILRRMDRVAKERTEISNHAWGLLHLYLASNADPVCDSAEDPNATPLGISQQLNNYGLATWAISRGTYAMTSQFIDLLMLGYYATIGMGINFSFQIAHLVS